MKRLVLAAALLGCSSSSTETAVTPADSGATSMDSADETAADAAVDLRGQRYCEILVGTVSGSKVHVAVFNTIGLSDCPADAWSKEDAAALKTENKADVVLLNGPRYWLIDSTAGSALIDTTVHTFGGIPMRQAGAIDVDLAAVPELQKPYQLHTIQRDTTFTFLAGKVQFELLDADGHVYTMQSYSVQKEEQTEATLATLGSKLTLPTGWSFRTRTLTADLVAKSTAGTATVTTDEKQNTYLRTE
ncbi:MAG: hypothetical protein ACXVEE_20180 [Polyangiales bacterium]